MALGLSSDTKNPAANFRRNAVHMAPREKARLVARRA